jgi:CheY-like chemotaxis protein
MRLAEKPIRFYTNIDSNIPNGLIGDEVRLRQVMLNLLSNAAKYTEKGHISLTITRPPEEARSLEKSGQVWLEITVSDTGKGMKSEDLAKLFSDFVQVDTKKNRGIEGTGLGLAITKKLCEAMGGDISVVSEYGKGSVFTIHIPQGINSTVSFAAVEDSSNKKVLVYEGRAVYAKSVCWSLHNMGVSCTLTATPEEFAEALLREEWYYVFSGYGLYSKIKTVMDSENVVFPGGKKPPVALMVEWGTEAPIPNVRFVSLPIQSLSIANILNGRADSKSFTESSGVSGIIRFTIPRARLLVVDDIATNLKVAEGLLAPYKAAVDICQSGVQAIEMVKRNNYDLVFMDHMMPDMDGIEATAHIRAWEAELEQRTVRFAIPIIALTANAVVGMREMFIKNGFSDFLAKPIDISKLDEILARWVPKEKRNEEIGIKNKIDTPHSSLLISHSSLLNLPGVDIQRGISLTGGTMALYRQVIGLFRKDAEERLLVLQNVPEAVDLPRFITQVHALKSASASIGAAELSEKAAALEAAGKAADIDFIRNNLPGFKELLAEMVDGIRTWETVVIEQDSPTGEYVYSTAVIRLLHELTAALESKNAGDLDRIMDELNAQTLDAKTKEALERISDDLLMTEFGSAIKIVSSLLESIGENKQ